MYITRPEKGGAPMPEDSAESCAARERPREDVDDLIFRADFEWSVSDR